MSEQPNESDQEPIKIQLSLDRLEGRFFLQLQRLLDILAVGLIGLKKVDEDLYSSYAPFFRVEPAKDRRLTREAAVLEAEQWYQSNVVRDAIELTNDFVQNCWVVCSILSLNKKNMPKGEDFNQIIGPRANKFHSLGLPAKIKKLRVDFNVFSELEPHVLSINVARACLVHRFGFVSDADLNTDDQLVIRWWTMRLSALSPDEKQEIHLDHPGDIVEAGWRVSAKIVDEQKIFKQGDCIKLSHREMTNVIFVLMRFAGSLVESVRNFSKEMGVSVREPGS